MKPTDHIFYAEEMNIPDNHAYPSYLQCEECQVNMPDNVIIKLIDKYKTQCYCPNCIAIKEQTNDLYLENDPDLFCEVTNQWGAVGFASGDETYFLDKEIMHRLLQHNLYPEEYKILRAKQNGFQYMTHEDFYTKDGTALQPLIQNEEQERE